MQSAVEKRLVVQRTVLCTDKKRDGETSTADSEVHALVTSIQQLALTSIETRVSAYNLIVRAAAAIVGFPHPALSPQLVPIETVRGNDYNPNKVAPPEMRLLRLSIQKDGITMPIVVASDSVESEHHEVVDGFHRATIVAGTPAIKASLGGYLPVVHLPKAVEARIASTVRHNIARGTHQVTLTADLVTMLKKHHWSDERIGKELGMDPEEVLRLKQVIGLAEAFKDHEFSRAWTPWES